MTSPTTESLATRAIAFFTKRGLGTEDVTLSDSSIEMRLVDASPAAPYKSLWFTARVIPEPTSPSYGMVDATIHTRASHPSHLFRYTTKDGAENPTPLTSAFGNCLDEVATRFILHGVGAPARERGRSINRKMLEPLDMSPVAAPETQYSGNNEEDRLAVELQTLAKGYGLRMTSVSVDPARPDILNLDMGHQGKNYRMAVTMHPTKTSSGVHYNTELSFGRIILGVYAPDFKYHAIDQPSGHAVLQAMYSELSKHLTSTFVPAKKA